MSKEELKIAKQIINLVKKGDDVEVTRTKDGKIKAFVVKKKKFIG